MTAVAAARAEHSPRRPSGSDVSDWYRTAAPGAHYVYFIGIALPKGGDGAVAAARRLVDAGLALPVQVRLAPGLFEYRIIRRANAEKKPQGRGRSLPPGPCERVSGEAGQLLSVLRRLANLGQPCPVNAELADMAALKDADAVRYRLTQLERAGSIKVSWPQDSIRVVQIVETGRKTARLLPVEAGR